MIYCYINYKIICDFDVETERSEKMLNGIETGNFYGDTDSVKLKEKQVLNSVYGMYANVTTTKLKNLTLYNQLPDTDFISRMVDEAQQLQIKTDKLKKFIDNNPKFNELSLHEQDLMRRQLNAMQQYLEFLVLRLEMHKND